MNLRQFTEATAAFQNAIDFGTRETNAVALNGRAEVLKAQGDLPAALAAFDAVIASHPEDVVAKCGRAEVLKVQGDLPAALAAFDAVIASHPEDVVAKNGRISVLVVMERLDEALAELAPCSPKSRDDWISFHIRGMISLYQRDLAEAESIFGRGAGECPFADSRSYFETALAVVRLQQGRLLEARDIAERKSEGRWFGPMTALLVHINGRMENFAAVNKLFEALPEPPNMYVGEAFAELERRYVKRQPAAFSEDWLIKRELNYLLSC